MKAFAITSAVLSTLLVLTWPMFLFIGGFTFDAPLNPADDAKRTILVEAALSYPLAWIIAMGNIVRRRIRSSPKKWWESPTAYLFLVPYAQLLVIFVLVEFNIVGFAKR
jgi:hypothetical protein